MLREWHSNDDHGRLKALDQGFNGINQNRKTINQIHMKMLKEQQYQEDLFL